MLHLALHFLVPAILALTFFRQTWRTSYLIMLAGLTIDADHLLADPIYDPGRCSIGFHPLHTLPPAAVYAAALFWQKTRVLGLGLCMHIALDAMDCQMTSGIWYHDAGLGDDHGFSTQIFEFAAAF